jgi:large conductance mechanosensitive channel
MGFFKEFREFALKGNVLDLAIGVIIGAAFNKIVTALTDTLLMPIVSLIIGKGGVNELYFTVGDTVFPYGRLLQAIIDFILVALVLFVILRVINRMRRRKEEVAPAPPEYSLSEKLLMEIRDELKKEKGAN